MAPETLPERGFEGGEVHGLDIRLDVRPVQLFEKRGLEVPDHRLDDAFGGIGTELVEHQGGRGFEIANRAELQIEDGRHRDGDRDGERHTKADAAVVQQPRKQSG